MPSTVITSTLPPAPASPVTDAYRQAVLRRNNVHVVGAGQSTLLLCNGFGCSQHIWHYLLPALMTSHRVVLFDQVGTGESDLTAYDPVRYATMAGYVEDVVEICQVLDLREVVVIGHSAGAMVALLAASQAPQYFAKVILLAGSPCYVNEPGYYGGFERADVLEVLAGMDTDFGQWADMFARLLLGSDHANSLGEELTASFCQAEPVIARQFARLAFLGDSRAELPRLRLPTLLLQCSEDIAVPAEVGDYLLTHLSDAQLIILKATGHCPHLSAPLETLAAMQAFLA